MSAYRAVVVGDLSTGKTSLISTLLTGKFPGQLGPTCDLPHSEVLSSELAKYILYSL